jgi:hypothetical protein
MNKKAITNFKHRILDISCLDKKVNTFEITDIKDNIIFDSCEKYQDSDYVLKDGDTMTFYFVGMQESMYTKQNPKKPITCNITGTPPFEVIEYLYKNKKMNIHEIFTLYLRMCEGCINQLESYITGKKYERNVNTECSFCKEI